MLNEYLLRLVTEIRSRAFRVGDLRRDGVIPRKVHVRNTSMERNVPCDVWVDDELVLAVAGLPV